MKIKTGDKCSGAQGQSTVEVLIAILVLTVALSSAVVVIFGGQSLGVDSEESNQALRLARESLESLSAAGNLNFGNLASSTVVQNEFTKQLIVESVDSNTKRLTSRVTWQTDPLRTQTQELVMLVTNWTGMYQYGGDSGGSGTSGNWCNPKTMGSVDLGPGNSATGLDVLNKIVYLTASASSQSKPDFLIVDVSDPQNRVIRSSLDTGSTLNAVDVAGSYAYVANNSTTLQLQVIDVTSSSTPSLVVQFTLPGVSGSGAVGNAIYYYAGRVYMGTKKATGPEFHVIDISNPLSPISLGSFEVGNDVAKIVVQSSTAYLAIGNGDDKPNLKLLDVSNPGSISLISSVNTDEEGRSLVLVNKKLYFASDEGGGKELAVYDVTNATSVQFLGAKSIGEDVNDLTVRDKYAFLATSDSNKEFQVWDISDPAHIASCATFNFPQNGSGIDFEDNLVYMSVRSNDALRIITSQ